VRAEEPARDEERLVLVLFQKFDDGVGCLPVVENNQLVGIVTSYDFLEASARLFQQHLAPNYQPKSRGAAQGG